MSFFRRRIYSIIAANASRQNISHDSLAERYYTAPKEIPSEWGGQRGNHANNFGNFAKTITFLGIGGVTGFLFGNNQENHTKNYLYLIEADREGENFYAACSSFDRNPVFPSDIVEKVEAFCNERISFEQCFTPSVGADFFKAKEVHLTVFKVPVSLQQACIKKMDNMDNAKDRELRAKEFSLLKELAEQEYCFDNEFNLNLERLTEASEWTKFYKWGTVDANRMTSHRKKP